MASEYYCKGFNVFERVGDFSYRFPYIRADHPDKAERICRALNALAKLEAKNAACGWPTEWVDSA